LGSVGVKPIPSILLSFGFWALSNIKRSYSLSNPEGVKPCSLLVNHAVIGYIHSCFNSLISGTPKQFIILQNQEPRHFNFHSSCAPNKVYFFLRFLSVVKNP
jgi:hypothetical protein